jgi:DNA polymerase III subunit epsilon
MNTTKETRLVALDTETTGLVPSEGHRIIEIGCVEIVDCQLTGRVFHTYLKPDIVIEPSAIEIHGITNEMLKDKPRFEEIVDEFLAFIKDAELIIHNAAFDTVFFNHELSLLKPPRAGIENFCRIFDTLTLARSKHPGKDNTFDELCKRYKIEFSETEKHTALHDADKLAHLYLSMTR